MELANIFERTWYLSSRWCCAYYKILVNLFLYAFPLCPEELRRQVWILVYRTCCEWQFVLSCRRKGMLRLVRNRWINCLSLRENAKISGIQSGSRTGETESQDCHRPVCWCFEWNCQTARCLLTSVTEDSLAAHAGDVSCGVALDLAKLYHLKKASHGILLIAFWFCWNYPNKLCMSWNLPKAFTNSSDLYIWLFLYFIDNCFRKILSSLE